MPNEIAQRKKLIKNKIMAIKSLKKKCHPFQKDAWLPLTEAGNGDVLASKFSGTPWLASDESWPGCPSCGQEMLLLLQLNIAQLPSSIQIMPGSGLLQLFLCLDRAVQCQVSEPWQPFSPNRLIRIVEPRGAAKTTAVANTAKKLCQLYPPRQITGWSKIADFPNYEEYEEYGITLEDEDFENFFDEQPEEIDLALGVSPVNHDKTTSIDLHNPNWEHKWERIREEYLIQACQSKNIDMLVAAEGDKLGGWPCWLQGIQYPQCPLCRCRMDAMIFQIDSTGANLPNIFSADSIGYLTCCPHHQHLFSFSWVCN